MPKLAPLKPREVEVIFFRNGFIINISKSSHKQYFHQKTRAHVTVPFHSKDIPIGTLRSIVRQSQLSIEFFRR